MKRICLIILCIFLALMFVACSNDGNNSKNKKPHINENNKGADEVDNTTFGLKEGWNDLRLLENVQSFNLPYQIYLPKDYSKDKAYPVLFFIHGNGSRGNDNTSQFNNAKICETLINNSEHQDIIIIAPQCDKDTQWVESDHTKGNYILQSEMTYCLQVALDIFDYWTNKLSTDNSRYYLYGNSMGAYACYDLLSRFPDKWACAVVVAGCGDLNYADKLKDIPIWMHHGDEDTLVPYEGSVKMYDALKQAGGKDNIILTTYKGQGHTIFNAVGFDPSVADWIWEQRLINDK